MKTPDQFEQFSFICEEIGDLVSETRSQNPEWFALAEDLNAALMRTAVSAKANVKENLWHPKSVAVRILLRSCGAMQAIVLLTERAMLIEGRTLTRNLIENAICIAALRQKPDDFVKIIRDDSEASLQRQRKFVIAQNLVDDDKQMDSLRTLIDEIGKFPSMNLKKIAAMGPLERKYIAFQRFSDGSSHLSARSLHHHIFRDVENQGFQYRWCIADDGQNSATLHYSAMAGLAIGIAATEIFADAGNNAEYGDLVARFEQLPNGTPV